MAQKLTIEFQPKGNKALVEAVKQMDVATKRLQGKTSQYEKELKKLGLSQTQINKVLKSGTKNLRIQAGAFATIRSNLLLYAFAVGLLTKAYQTLLGTYTKQEKAEKKLQTALGETNTALLNQASALQKVTRFGDEAVIEVQALIGAFTQDEEQIKSLTKATLDLAEAKGMELTAAADLVSKTFGSTTNSLSRYGVQVKGASGSTERLTSLTENIADLFGGQAVAAADTLGGSMEQMTNAVGDASEALGKAFAPIMMDVSKLFTSAAQGAKEFFLTFSETPLDRTIRQLQELGEDTTKFEKVAAKIKISDAWKEAGVEMGNVGSLDDEILKTQKAIESSSQGIVSSLELQGDEYDKLLEGGHKIEDLEKKILDAKLKNVEGVGLMGATLKIPEEALLEQYNILLDNQEIFENDLTAHSEKLALLIKIKAEIAEANKLYGFGEDDDTPGFFKRIFGDEEQMDEIMKNFDLMQERITGFAEAEIESEKAYAEAKIAIIDSVEQKELDALKSTWLYKKMTDKQKAAAEKEVTDKFIKQREKLRKDANKDIARAFKATQLLKASQAIMNTAEQITESLGNPWKVAFIAAMGAVQLATIKAQKPPKMQYGGLVGGRRHSAGGTMIEAEQGEFVMSRDATEAIGIENLNRMNTAGGGGGGSSIIINNPILGKDTIEDEIVPQIKEALRRGGDIN